MTVDDILKLLEDQASFDLNILYEIWRKRNFDLWSCNLDLYRKFGERFLDVGEPLMAYDIVTEGLKCSTQDIRLRQLLALSFARSGATEQANKILVQLYTEGSRVEETIGIFARTYKDLWMKTPESELRKKYLISASQYYSEAYDLSQGFWSGINAATMSLLLGETDRACTLAREIYVFCKELEQITDINSNRYWILATLGEAALVMKQWSEAEYWYTKSGELGRRLKLFGDLNSTRRQARLIIEFLGIDGGFIEKCFEIPKVAVFTGHMVDQPDRNTPRFPSHLQRYIKNAITKRLKELDIGFGYSSAACGSDIIFLESVLKIKGEINVVLPYEKKQFADDSVDIIPGSNWKDRYYRLLDQAMQVLTASEYRLEEGSIFYDYANLLLFGLAKKRAEQLETELVTMAVWDERQGDGPGDTETNVKRWSRYGNNVEFFNPRMIRNGQPLQVRIFSGEITNQLHDNEPELPKEFTTHIMAILFADVVKFTKLTEKEITLFVQNFLGSIADMIASSSHAPELKNTWGDALYFVFSNVKDAGLFALELCNKVNRTKWVEKGLPESMNLRIALHAGPVLFCKDPVTEARTYMGTHVCHAARIEPITPPGQVYASQAFAAIASAENITEFTCEYVGKTPMAKGYGIFPTYRIIKK